MTAHVHLDDVRYDTILMFLMTILGVRTATVPLTRTGLLDGAERIIKLVRESWGDFNWNSS